METDTVKRLAGLYLCLLATVSVATAAGKTPDFEEIVPGDVSLLLVVDAPAMLSGWSDLPIAQLWQEPQVQRFLAPMVDSMAAEDWSPSVEAATGRSLQDILGMLTGKVVVGLSGLAEIMRDGTAAGDEAGFFVLAETGPETKEDAELWKQLADPRFGSDKADENAEYRVDTEELDGVDLHVWQVLDKEDIRDDKGWAIIDGVVVMARPRSLLRRVVTAVKSGADDAPLSGSGPFATMRRQLDGSDLLLYANLHDVVAGLEAAIAKDPPEPNPLGITPEAVIEALGLKALDAGYLSIRLGTPPARFDYGVVYQEARGLFKMMAFKPGADARPPLIPADALGGGVVNFAWMEMWEALHEILQDISPPLAAMIDAQIQQLGAGLEIDLVQALLGSLGGEMVSASFLDEPDEPGENAALEDIHSLFAIGLADRQSVEMGLEAVQSLASPGVELFDVEEYLGTEVHVSRPFPTGEGTQQTVFAYALTDRWLLIGLGSAEPVRRALSQMKNPGRTLWERPEVRAGLLSLPPGAASVGYQEISSQVNGLLESLLAVQEMAGDDEDDDLFNAEARPDAQLLERYFGATVSGLYRSDDNLHFTVLFLSPAG